MNIKTTIESLTVLDLIHSDQSPDTFALFCDDQTLYLQGQGEIRPLAKLPDIQLLNKPVKLYFCHPFICVSEQFGLNAAVIDIRDGEVRLFKREDYHADVSDYSIGFLRHNEQILLIHQTQWNRLDITDLATGQLLSKREVYIKDIGAEQTGKPNYQYDTKNYFDYFHGLLHIAPDNRHFLSNGWHWMPVDRIYCYNIDTYLHHYDPSAVGIDYSPVSGYNWGRPCTFIDDDLFVVAVDDHTPELDEEDLAEYCYKQLWFYRLSDITNQQWQPVEERSPKSAIISCKQMNCQLLDTGPYGEVYGQLYYDPAYQLLIGIGENSVRAATLDGQICLNRPEIANPGKNQHADIGSSHYVPGGRWIYHPQQHLFYRYNQQMGLIETKLLDSLLAG